MSPLAGGRRGAPGPGTPRWGRIRRWLADARWWLVGALAATTLALGYVGLHRYQVATGGPAGVWDLLYRDLQLFVLESGALSDGEAIPSTLEVARFLAPTIGAIALVQVLAAVFRDEVQLLRFRLSRGHVVVCGLGDQGATLARSLRDHDHRVLAIERDAENDHVAPTRSAGTAVLLGDATAVDTLRRAGVSRASWLIGLCGDGGTNAQIVAAAERLVAGRAPPLDVLARVDDPRLCDLLRVRGLAAADRSVRLDLFNVLERGAQVLLVRHPFTDEGSTATAAAPHVLVVGLGRFGRALLGQAARNWRAAGHGTGDRFVVTVVDRDAPSLVAGLEAADTALTDVCDLRPVALDVTSVAFESGTLAAQGSGEPSGRGDGPPPLTVAYVCLGDELLALRTGLVVHAWSHRGGAPVVVRSRTGVGVPALLQGPDTDPSYDDLHAFPVLDYACDAGVLQGGVYEVLAQTLHEGYVHRREREGWRFGDTLDAQRRTDPALAPWPQLAEPLRASNRAQAAHVGTKLAVVGATLEELPGGGVDPGGAVFTDDEVERLARLEHERWVDERRRAGWRPGERDPVRRRTPYLVDYDELPEPVKELDRAFIRDLPRVLARVGYAIVRSGPEEATSARPVGR